MTDAHARVAEAAFALSLITGAADPRGASAATDLAALEVVRTSRGAPGRGCVCVCMRGAGRTRAPRRAGLVTHHDSVPGTMRTNVSSDDSFYIGGAVRTRGGVIGGRQVSQLRARGRAGNDDVRSDYEAHLFDAIGNATDVASRALAALATPAGVAPPPPLAALNHVVTGTECVVVFNPLAWARAEVVWVDVASADVTVRDSAGDAVPAQLSVCGGGLRVGFIGHAPPLGFAVYEVAVGGGRAAAGLLRGRPGRAVRGEVRTVVPARGAPDFSISNGHVQVDFDGATGWMTRVTANGTAVAVEQRVAAYVNGSGGAYILFESAPAFATAGPESVTVTTGPVFAEACQALSLDATNMRSVCVRVYSAPAAGAAVGAASGAFVELVHDVGPIALWNEVVVQFGTDLRTGTTLYTDDTGARSWRGGRARARMTRGAAARLRDARARVQRVAEHCGCGAVAAADACAAATLALAATGVPWHAQATTTSLSPRRTCAGAHGSWRRSRRTRWASRARWTARLRRVTWQQPRVHFVVVVVTPVPTGQGGARLT